MVRLSELPTQIIGKSPAADRVLRQLAESLWYPLGKLPRHLTIVLSHHFRGIPFESLPPPTGEPVIARHTIRYAFGLGAGLGSHGRQRDLHRALVAGEDSFPGWDALKPMPESADFDIAVSPARTRLLVLSAWELFAARKIHDLISEGNNDDLVSPIPGVTAAALARMSPQVVSTLWKVDAVSTRIFMQRFYEALLKEREPAAALAVTNQDFIHSDRLAKWMKSRGLPAGPEIRNYRKPYHWAPFVLAIRGQAVN